jgi:energy-coupling factor transporter transmembrane protein EcfT
MGANYQESDKSFKERKYKDLVSAILIAIVSIFILFFMILSYTDKSELLFIVGFLGGLILITILIIKIIYNGSRMVKFQIKGDEFLISSNKKNEWIKINQTNKIKYFKINEKQVHVAIFYNNNKRLVIQAISKNNFKRIGKIFTSHGIKPQKATLMTWNSSKS